jgi:Cu(I)/Ag(I) efflux system membrane protein CusA/SilA
MINSVIDYSIQHRVWVIGASLALAVGGVLAVLQTPMDAVPDLSENQAIVFTEWPGHSPREIEDQITYPLSRNLQSLAGIRVVRGSSDVNMSMIWLIFEDSVDFATARARVHERLGGLENSLPSGVAPRLAPDAIPTGQIFWYTVEGQGYDLARLRGVQDWFVKHQLESVPGVAEVASVGGQVLEYHVDLDPFKLRDKRVELPAVFRELARSNAAIGGEVVHKGNAEYIVRGVGWLGAAADSDVEPDPEHLLHDLENVLVGTIDGRVVRMAELGRVALGARPRRGVLEKDGNEVVGGVVLMRYGQNPLDVTRRLKAKIAELQAGLPAGTRIVTAYERSPLIEGAIRTVTGTVIEAMLTATVCVVLVLMHFRTSFVISVTLPLSALASFVIMWILRRLGITDIQTNIMSLAGIAISIGVLVDSSIVITENVMHRLRESFGDDPVRGDTRAIVLRACQTVGQPIFFSVLIMLISFLPVFALGGIDGKMYRPLAFTKTFALFSVAILAVTLVPALCTLFIKGRIRRETDSWIVRSVIDVYRPVLMYSFDRPGALVWVLSLTLVLGAVPLGSRWALLPALGTALALTGFALARPLTRTIGMASLVLVALIGEHNVEQKNIPALTSELRMPLDEGMVMDMPITVPRASNVQSGDDLKARDMVLCRFPEVEMVLGKAGRAESPFDPAPLDMIESMVMLRPHELWPRRKITSQDARAQAAAVLDAFLHAGLIAGLEDARQRHDLLEAALDEATLRYDSTMREFAFQRNQEFTRDLEQTGRRPHRTLWVDHIERLNGELLDRAGPTFTRVIGEEILKRSETTDSKLEDIAEQVYRARQIEIVSNVKGAKPQASAAGHHGAGTRRPLPVIDPHPVLDRIYFDLGRSFSARLFLWPRDREEMAGSYLGELDRALSMPGWTNVWTMPIQNRVDMLDTGVNTEIGVRVLGRSQDDVVRASEDIAAVLRNVAGAANVIADPIRGKGYLEIRPDRERAARNGVSIGDINDVTETAIGGRIATTTVEGRERHAVRVRYQRDWVRDEETIRRLPIPVRDQVEPSIELALAGRSGDLSRGLPHSTQFVPLEDVASVSIVEGPATIKSENGLLRNYVRLSVRGRGIGEFLAEARRAVADGVELPEGTYIEWTGQFEHALATARTLLIVIPIVIVSIFVILYLTYHDWADACLMLLAVPGTIAGGVLFQWLFGFKFSVAVAVGYIACFGMAASTGMIMLVYLREAVANAGGLHRMSLGQLRQAVINGAVHRLRPKLLTEGTMILGLAPMLWASGVGAEVIRPMAAPVLGGILIADEVIDLLLPVLFYHIRRRRWSRLQMAPVPADQ